jgi:hypothetical protein
MDVENLLAWAKEHGARFCFTIKENTRTPVASKNIPANHEICFIPPQLLLSSTVVQNSALIIHFNQFLETNPEALLEMSGGVNYPFALDLVSMAMFIVQERFNEKSFWGPYLKSLPDKYSLPICWGESKIEKLLKNTPLEFKSIERIRWAKRVVAVVSRCSLSYFAADTWNLDNFIWAFSSILSRAFPKAKTSAEINDWITLSEICLYPVLDMVYSFITQVES